MCRRIAAVAIAVIAEVLSPMPDVSVVCRPGPRALEAALLDAVLADVAEARQDLTRLQRPSCVVVPSAALREHLLCRLAARAGAVAGVRVLTLGQLTREILTRRDEKLPGDAVAFDVIARRELAREDALARSLRDLEDGYGLAVGAVRDLLSAGLGAAPANRAEACLAPRAQRSGEATPDDPAGDRARATLRAAIRTADTLRGLDLAREGDRQSLAAAWVAAATPAELPWRGLHVHGFADATGRGTELLRRLLETPGSTLWLDLPDDPAAPLTPDRGVAFPRRFLARLGGAVTEAEAPPPLRAPETRTAFDAVGVAGEAREVAERVRRLLAEGVAPESIGVIARRLEPHAVALRRAFRALGIPFSGGRLPSALLPARRRLDALLRLLSAGAEVSLDLWLDLMTDERMALHLAPEGSDAGPLTLDAADLRLALRVLGLVTLDDLASVDLGARLGQDSFLRLPARRGLGMATEKETGAEAENGEADAAPAGQALAHRVSRAVLEGAHTAARALTRTLADWPASASAAEHVDVMRRLVALLGPALQEACGELLAETWARLAEAPGQLPDLTPEEARALLAGALRDVPREALGGRGGGVLVLGLAQARSLTFEHLFLIGLEHEVFPRRASQDPFLDDTARQRLRPVLPGLALVRDGADEERFLFAQLHAAARHLTLSFRRGDEDGSAVMPSPFWDRLAASAAPPEKKQIPRGLTARLQRPDTCASLVEAGVVAALSGRRELLPEVVGAAYASGRMTPPDEEHVRAVARARGLALEEIDPSLDSPEGRRRRRSLGPWDGFIGAPGNGDPRQRDLFVTRLEDLASCPWRMLLTRQLQIEALPDPAAALAGLDPLVLGNAVHGALEILVVEATQRRSGADLENLFTLEPVAMPRPAKEQVDAAVTRAAASAARAAGLHLVGLHRALERRVRPIVEQALDLDWKDEAALPGILGPECKGHVDIPWGQDAVRRLFFRIDRADVTDDGVRLTDYKTGRPKIEVKRRDAVERNLARLLARGELLQGAAYAAAGGATSFGRYLHVDPQRVKEGAPPALEVPGDEESLLESFHAVAGVLIEALESGALPPRFEDAVSGRTENACERCEVRLACHRDDSGYRTRLRALAQSDSAPGVDDPDLARWRGLWWLGRAPQTEEGS